MSRTEPRSASLQELADEARQKGFAVLYQDGRQFALIPLPDDSEFTSDELEALAISEQLIAKNEKAYRELAM